MLTVDAIAERAGQIVADCALLPVESVSYTADFAGGGVDSLSLLRIVAAAEAEFGVVLADERFASIRSLRDLVAELVRAGATRR